MDTGIYRVITRSAFIRSITGRALVCILALKAVAMAAIWIVGRTSFLESFDRLVNLALIVAVTVAVIRTSGIARGRTLWRVRRKLVLSYVLVGAVPFLLLGAFSVLGFLLIFFDISSYLVQNQLSSLTDQANTLARTTLTEIERTAFDERPDVLSRRQGVLETRFPGVAVAMIPTAGNPRCGVAPSKDLPVVSGTLPRWVSCRGFAGLLLSQTGGDTAPLHLVARAAALPNRANADYAILVDLPVDETRSSESLRAAGIQLRNLSVVQRESDVEPVVREDNGESATGRARSLVNTATFLTYTDWKTGLTGRAAIGMNVEIGRLYRWLGGDKGRSEGVAFSRILLFMLGGIGALLLIIEVVALGNGLALARSITDSVDELFRGTEHVKRGDFSHKVTRRSDDQLGDLAVSFNEMTASISGLLEERHEKRRLEEELRIARDIQLSLLPQGPLGRPGLSMAAVCAPAREVGGDYYDVLPLAGGKLGVLIADVAGKGMSAALYMAELKGLMLSLSRIHSSPRALLIEADRIISRHLDSRSFITMTYAVIDLEGRTLTCARAGHTPFIRIPSADGDRRARVLAPGGMVLGLNLDNGERFEELLSEITIPMAPGDLFFFFTDGVTDAMNSDGAFFGESRLAAFLEATADSPPEAIRTALLEEVNRFAGGQPQHDDITMVIFKVDQAEAG
jgi:serine phosphatase RsbU (regulator of sigma subunit)